MAVEFGTLDSFSYSIRRGAGLVWPEMLNNGIFKRVDNHIH